MSLCRLCTRACSPRPFAPAHTQHTHTPTTRSHIHTHNAPSASTHTFRIASLYCRAHANAKYTWCVCEYSVCDRIQHASTPTPSPTKRRTNATRAREQFCTDQFDCVKCVDSFAATATATTATNDTKINLSPSRDKTPPEYRRLIAM